MLVWSIVHSILAYRGFYQDTTSMPPRFGLVLIPGVLFIILGLLPRHHTWLQIHRNPQLSMLLHTVRLPVEIVLWGLFMHQMVPQLMTFEGRNFDILMGITAPIIGALYYRKKIGKRALLAWNIIGLILVVFILVNGLLSAELPFQQFGFEQPNRALSYFPFVLLPALVVPVVIWTHLSDIILLRKELKSDRA